MQVDAWVQTIIKHSQQTVTVNQESKQMAEYTAVLTQGTESLTIGGVVADTIEEARECLKTLMDDEDWSLFIAALPVVVEIFNDQNTLLWNGLLEPLEP